MDNRKFWKTVKPNFTDKSKAQKIILVEDGEIICDSTKNTEVLNDYFINIVKDLDIPNIATTEESVKTDPIENIIQTYANHSSICRIREHVDQTNQFSFCKINVSQMEKEINNLNPKQAPGEDGIPANIVNEQRIY